MTIEALRLHDLPCDLVREILSRVPATSLRRLSFTCKSWNALFKDQEFIKRQLDKAAKQCMVLMLSVSKFYSMNVNLNGIHDNVVDPQTLQSLNDFHNTEKLNIYKIFHCDGLLLCTTWDSRLVVWNPCTGQIRWIPYSDRYKLNSRVALGYENNKSCQTYKILRCSWDSGDIDRRIVECGIYDFESHSWKDLKDVFPKNCTVTSKGVSLKGNIYLIANKYYEKNYLLLSFNFSTNNLRCMSVPFDDCVPTALSAVREERLSVLCSSFVNTPKIEIWMTTHDPTKVVSWSNFLSLELDKNNPEKGLSSVTSFFVDEENKAALLWDQESFNAMVYIVGEDNLFRKIPVGESRLQFLRPSIDSYVPSLVRIQQGGVMTRERKRKSRH